MITIISGTNRSGSECLKFAKKYQELLKELTREEVKLLALEDIPHDWFFAGMFSKERMADSLKALQDEYMRPADKFVFVTSEYNGSFPGALKVFIDGISVRELGGTFKRKKAALLGITTGRQGNLRGMDHLADVLNNMGTVVLPNKLPISRIKELMDEHGNITDDLTIAVMKKQAEELVNF